MSGINPTLAVSGIAPERRPSPHQTAPLPTLHIEAPQEPLTERHEPVTERLVRGDVAVLEDRQVTERLEVVKADAEGLVAPPTDDEVYSYFGPQMRWVQVLLMAASVLAGWSLLQFALASVKVLWPMLIVLGLNVIGTVLLGADQLQHQARVSEITPRAFRGLGGAGIEYRRLSSHVRRGPGGSAQHLHPCQGDGMGAARSTCTFSTTVIAARSGNWPHSSGSTTSCARIVVTSRKPATFSTRSPARRATTSSFWTLTFARGPISCGTWCPYIDDPTIGIVQSPQYFDSGENLNWIQRTAGATQELFYRWILPSRDRFNAAICVGTCALYRREALAAAGGFAQIEHSEDIHTGL